MKERGSALLTSIVIVIVLLSLSGVFFTTVINRSKNISSEEKGLQAYYLAEAGVQYGIAAGITAISKGALAEEATLLIRENALGGTFEVTVIRVGATSFTVNSTGDYLSTVRKKMAEYEYGEEGEGEGEGAGAGGGSEAGGDDCEDAEQWVKDKQYQKNDIVCYDGKKFYARNNTAKNEKPGLKSSPWQEITELWRDFNIYLKDDIVLYNDYDKRPFYARNNTDKNQKPDSIASNNPWQELTENWTKFNMYLKDDIVFYEDRPYKARNNTAKNQQPGLTSSPWDELTDEWRPFNQYKSGNIVLYSGQRYKAKWNNGPNSTPPPSSSEWELTSSPLPAPVLLSISVTPVYASIQVSQTQSFTAKAIYTNGFTNLSSPGIWSNLNPSIASLLGNVAKGISAGTSTITASFGDQTGTATLKVNELTSPEPELTLETSTGRLLWEKEVIEE